MKNFLIASAFIIGFGVNANAQTETSQKTTTTTTVSAPKQYTVIDRKTVDNASLEKIGTRYGGYSILEAQKSADGEYKLSLSKEGKNTTAYFSSTGEFIREE